MSKKSILQYLKEVIDDMVDSNGNIRTLPIGGTGRRKLTNNRIKFLEDLIRLVLGTDIVNEETKIYLTNRYMSIRKVNDYMNDRLESGEEPKNVNTTISKIQYDKNKLTKIFGESMFVDVLTNGRDISNYERILLEQYVKYNGKRSELRKNLALDIPEDCVYAELDDDKFEELLTIIAPYTKSQMKFIAENLDREACGYFNYLMSMPGLKGIDKERAERLEMLLDYEEDE